MTSDPALRGAARLSPQSRLRVIEERLRADGYVEVAPLAADLDVSEVTIRRYLDRLVERGLAERTRGGALRVDAPLSDPLFAARQANQRDSKARVAKLCADQIPDGSTVFVGGGTTTCEVARFLMVRPDLTIFTSNLAAASQYRSDGAAVFVTGGAIRGSSCSLVGDITRTGLSRFCADFTVIGADSVSAASGAMMESAEEADVARQMIANTNVGVLCVVDSTKWSPRSGHVAASPAELTVVVSDRVPRAEAAGLAEQGVRVIDVATLDGEAVRAS